MNRGRMTKGKIVHDFKAVGRVGHKPRKGFLLNLTADYIDVSSFCIGWGKVLIMTVFLSSVCYWF